MSETVPPEVDCPQCGRTIPWSEDYPHRPLCSERCRAIDFGAWATESYRIPAEPASPEDLEEAEEDDDSPRHYL